MIDGSTNEPLVGARVVVVDSADFCLTRPDGSYKITCTSGKHTLKFLMDGYENHDESILIDGKNLALTIVLQPLEPQPPSNQTPPDNTTQPTQDQTPSNQTSPPSNETATITGKVTDAKTGHPIAGATVMTGIHQAITGADGTYSLSVAEGTHNLTVSARGYEANTVSVTVTEEKTYSIDVSLVPPQYSMKVTASPDWIFSRDSTRESTITVVVKKADGTPAVGIEVSFSSSGTDVVGRFKSKTAVTDQKGTATVVWSCSGEPAVEQLNNMYAARLSYWTTITASVTAGDQLFKAECWIVIQKEACHRSC